MSNRFLLGAALACSVFASPVMAASFTVGPQVSTYAGFTRGYYFTAPTAFTITSLFIPTDASTGNQWLEVVRLNGAPGVFPTTTNAFTSLGYFANQASGSAVNTSITVGAGDIIGILGSRGTNTVNSYAEGPFTSTIGGLPVTLQRLGFQASLVDQQASNLFTEAAVDNPFYSRVNFDFSVAAVPEPATWAMMLVGFGAVGATMRRRQKVRTRVSFAA